MKSPWLIVSCGQSTNYPKCIMIREMSKNHAQIPNERSGPWVNDKGSSAEGLQFIARLSILQNACFHIVSDFFGHITPIHT